MSVALALAAIASEAIALGALPRVSLFLAGSFGCYGLARADAGGTDSSGSSPAVRAVVPRPLDGLRGWQGRW